MNQIRDLRSTRMYINSATTRLSGQPAGGRCLRLDCRQRYTAFASKENAVLSRAFSVLSFFPYVTTAAAAAAGDVGGVFMRIAAGFREDKRPRESGFGCRRLDSQMCGASSAAAGFCVNNAN